MGGGAHADSVMDRIIRDAVRIEMGDVNMRELLANGVGDVCSRALTSGKLEDVVVLIEAALQLDAVIGFEEYPID